MRVAYVCADPGVPVYGRKGCSVHVQEVIRSLLARGAEVELFANRTEGNPPPGLETVPLHHLPPPCNAELRERERDAQAANADLRVALEKAAPFDLVYERYAIWSYAGMAVARTWRVPGLLEVNAPLVAEQAASRGLVDREGAERIADRLFRSAGALIAVSEEVGSYLARFDGTLGRIHVVPNGVNPERFPPGQSAAIRRTAGDFVVGFVGTLKPWHGLPVLVDAFSRLHAMVPMARLLVVGGGPEQASLEADLDARGLRAAAILTGPVNPIEVPGLIAAMDVAVAPYPNIEPFYFSPLKVYEYMAAGRAVVGSRIGQLPLIITHGANGLLCPPGDPVALASAIDELYCDPPLRARLGEAARATVLQNHTWDAAASRILQIAAQSRQVIQRDASGRKDAEVAI